MCDLGITFILLLSPCYCSCGNDNKAEWWILSFDYIILDFDTIMVGAFFFRGQIRGVFLGKTSEVRRTSVRPDGNWYQKC